MNIKTQIESILFIAGKPLTIKQLADIVGRKKPEIETALQTLKQEYSDEEKGLKVLEHEGKIQITTSPDVSEVVEKYLKEELTGEMTRPQLETLTIIAYRGPITKMELEQIRGVNCSIILRNLQIRGLVESNLDNKIKTHMYTVTPDFVRHLGLTSIKELPDYEKLSQNETLENLLNQEESENNKGVDNS